MQMLAPGQASWGQFAERIDQLLSKPWFPHVVNFIALLLLTASLARWTWLLITPRLLPATAPTVATSAPAAPAAINVQPIIAAHLFGVAPTAAAGNVADIPLSSLNLVLTGLIAAGSGSIALIRVEGEPEAPFVIGQEITAGAVLDAVYADRAIIVRDGVAESLLLEGAAQALPGTPARETPAAPVSGIGANDIREQGPNAYVISRDAFKEQMRTPQKLLSQSLMVPNPGGGFSVREIQPGSVYEKLGLKVGDVVRSANGQLLNSVEDVMKLYQQSNNNSYIHLEVLRNGRVENLQYTLQ